MNEIVEGLLFWAATLGVIALCLWSVAWITVFPTIGFLWVIGWI